jgi:hypothetical protein
MTSGPEVGINDFQLSVVSDQWAMPPWTDTEHSSQTLFEENPLALSKYSLLPKI